MKLDRTHQWGEELLLLWQLSKQSFIGRRAYPLSRDRMQAKNSMNGYGTDKRQGIPKELWLEEHWTKETRVGQIELARNNAHLLLDCLASEPLRRAIFGTSFRFDLWSKP